jgi:hypothetical protein
MRDYRIIPVLALDPLGVSYHWIRFALVLAASASHRRALVNPVRASS